MPALYFAIAVILTPLYKNEVYLQRFVLHFPSNFTLKMVHIYVYVYSIWNTFYRNKALLVVSMESAGYNLCQIQRYAFRLSNCGIKEVIWGILLPYPFISGMEIVTPEKRAVATSVRYLFWTSGMLLTVGAAYAFRHWRTFLLVATVPSMLSTILLLCVLTFSLDIWSQVPSLFNLLLLQAFCFWSKLIRGGSYESIT